MKKNCALEKSHGFQLERSEVRSVIALSRLCFVLAVATLLLTVLLSTGCSEWLSADGWIVIGSAATAISGLALCWFKGIFHHGWHLFLTIALQGKLDPDPAFASKKQLHRQLQREFTVKSYSFVT